MNLPLELKQAIEQESSSRILTRSDDRKRKLGEVFTPSWLVIEILEKLPDEVWEEGKTFLDPACGNGQFLLAALKIKQYLGHKNPLSTIYGVDIMEDNVEECKERLLAAAKNTKRNQAFVDKNIVCADGLKYDFEFNNSKPKEEKQGRLF